MVKTFHFLEDQTLTTTDPPDHDAGVLDGTEDANHNGRDDTGGTGVCSGLLPDEVFCGRNG